MLFKEIKDNWRTMDDGQRPIIFPHLVHSTGEVMKGSNSSKTMKWRVLLLVPCTSLLWDLSTCTVSCNQFGKVLDLCPRQEKTRKKTKGSNSKTMKLRVLLFSTIESVHLWSFKSVAWKTFELMLRTRKCGWANQRLYAPCSGNIKTRGPPSTEW